MARKLKTFRTSLGFYDLAVAAPSMKAALEAWGAGSNLFHQGIATETDDPDVVAATMSKPGVVLSALLSSAREMRARVGPSSFFWVTTSIADPIAAGSSNSSLIFRSGHLMK